jgi:hypothetical protein
MMMGFTEAVRIHGPSDALGEFAPQVGLVTALVDPQKWPQPDIEKIAKVFDQGENTLGDAANLHKAFNNIAEDAGDVFLKDVARIGDELGPEAAQGILRVLDDTVDTAILTAVRASPDALYGLGKLIRGGLVNEAELKIILQNREIFTTGYTQAHLLDDLGTVADVRGVGDLVSALKNPTQQVKGVRYELETASYIQRNGDNAALMQDFGRAPIHVVELTRRINPSAAGKTDIDVVLREAFDSQTSKLVQIQVKATSNAINTTRKNIRWVRLARSDLRIAQGGELFPGQIKFVVKDGERISGPMQQYFNQETIAVIRSIPHR